MRASEIYETRVVESGNPTMTSMDMINHILVPEYGFQKYRNLKMYIKHISNVHYITVTFGMGWLKISLFNRKTMNADDELMVSGGNKTEEFIGFREKHKLLNKITDWTRHFSSTDPIVETVSFNPGDKVTYSLQPNKRLSPKGNAVFKSISSAKKNHAYIETETQGTILVPLSELSPRD